MVPAEDTVAVKVGVSAAWKSTSTVKLAPSSARPTCITSDACTAVPSYEVPLEIVVVKFIAREVLVVVPPDSMSVTESTTRYDSMLNDVFTCSSNVLPFMPFNTIAESRGAVGVEIR